MEPSLEVEEFIQDCFRQRTATVKKALEIHKSLREKFFHPDCFWDSRQKSIESSEAERLENVSISNREAAYATTKCNIGNRLRYRLQRSASTWRISEVEIECGLCHVRGADPKCTLCHGKCWLDPKEVMKTYLSPNSADGRDEGDVENDSVISVEANQFMAEYFGERSIFAKKEAEIYHAYREKFYSPDCSWGNREVVAQWSQSETVVSVLPVEKEVHVVTKGFSVHACRYHLRPTNQTYLILEIDMECLVCRKNGLRENCFMCRGTGWCNGKQLNRNRGETDSSSADS